MANSGMELPDKSKVPVTAIAALLFGFIVWVAVRYTGKVE